MLKVYLAEWCPHCRATVRWLEERKLPFEKVDMDTCPPDVEQQVVAANGGGDWKVPTLEYKGQWCPGKTFDAARLEADLKKLGAL